MSDRKYPRQSSPFRTSPCSSPENSAYQHARNPARGSPARSPMGGRGSPSSRAGSPMSCGGSPRQPGILGTSPSQLPTSSQGPFYKLDANRKRPAQPSPPLSRMPQDPRLHSSGPSLYQGRCSPSQSRPTYPQQFFPDDSRPQQPTNPQPFASRSPTSGQASRSPFNPMQYGGSSASDEPPSNYYNDRSDAAPLESTEQAPGDALYQRFRDPGARILGSRAAMGVVDQMLAAVGRIRKNAPGDGNCMLFAISWQMPFDIDHVQLRQQIHAYLLRMPKPASFVGTDEQYQQDVARYQRNGEWALDLGDYIPSIVQELFDVHVVVMTGTMPSLYFPYNNTTIGPNTIVLINHSNHYSAGLLPTAKVLNTPAAPAIPAVRQRHASHTGAVRPTPPQAPRQGVLPCPPSYQRVPPPAFYPSGAAEEFSEDVEDLPSPADTYTMEEMRAYFRSLGEAAAEQLYRYGFQQREIPKTSNSFFESIVESAATIRKTHEGAPITVATLRNILREELQNQKSLCGMLEEYESMDRLIGTPGQWDDDWTSIAVYLLKESGINVVVIQDRDRPYDETQDYINPRSDVLIVKNEDKYFDAIEQCKSGDDQAEAMDIDECIGSPYSNRDWETEHDVDLERPFRGSPMQE